MEVQFRPLPRSALARRVNSGRSESETGQSFMEVIESVTGAENNPEENPNTGRQQEPPRPTGSFVGGATPVEESEQGGSVEPTTSNIHETAETSTPEAKPLGVRIDMTA